MELTLPSYPAPRARLVYRAAVATWFFLQGLVFASWASRIPFVQQRMGLSETQLGLVLLAIPLGQLPSLPFSGWLIARQGSRRTLLLGAVAYCLALLGLGAAPTPALLVACLVAFGFASNLMNIAVNTQAVGVEGLYEGQHIMASFHGIWSAAGFVGAAIGTFMNGHAIAPLWHFLLIVGVVVLIGALSQGKLLLRDAHTATDQPIFVRPDGPLLGLGLIAFCAMICEGAMFDWSGVYFKKVVLARGAWVSAGYTAFMSTMALGRFGADWLTGRLGPRRVIQLSGLLTAAGLLVAVGFPTLVTALIGFMLVGFGVSSVVPLVYSAAGKTRVMSPGMALAAVSTIGFLGFLFGPPLIGLVAGATSLRVSYSLIALMGLCVTWAATRVKL